MIAPSLLLALLVLELALGLLAWTALQGVG
mgnify:CR=1 FL=1